MPFTPKIITNDEENRAALAASDACLDAHNNLIPGKEDLHALLGSLIDAYERERFPSPEPTSAYILECTMDAKGWSQTQLAKVIGSAGITSEILSGKRDLSAGIIEKLAKEGMPIKLLTSFIPIKHRKLLAKFATTPEPKAPRAIRPAHSVKRKV